ncbi:MAG: GTPase HflX [Myxococcales bacterium]|nr:GTPase HflX [Myxococcales bacterium]
MTENVPPTPRALLLGVQLDSISDQEFGESLDELARLAKTLGYEVIGRVTQKRHALDRAAYLGPGKVAELRPIIEAQGDHPTMVMADHEITPSQARNLEKATGTSVLDRTAVILEIFHRHAQSRQAKAQVEMVRLVYMAPRMREQGHEKKADRVRGGGKGGKGSGESKLETDRRKIRDRITELKEEIELIERERTTQRARRRDLRRVALVGYTNAGKSTLMRALTDSDVYVADKLFATLDTTVRTLQPDVHPPILISDTVGFIRRLPHGLVASFKSTLDEALEASLILHLVDAADPAWPRQMAATLEVLKEIGASDVPRRMVFNKADRITDEGVLAQLAARHPDALVVSSKNWEDVARVRTALIEFFDRGSVEGEICLGWTRQALRAQIFEHCQVLEERSDEAGTTFRVRAPKEELERIVGLLGDRRGD